MTDDKFDIFDDGWRYKVPIDDLSPDEAFELIKGIEEATQGKTRSIEEIRKGLRGKEN